MKQKYIFSSTGLIAAVMAISLAVSGITSAITTKRHIESSLVRLHILANSDSEEDQQLKLKVRDELLKCSEEIFEPYSSSEQAEKSLSENMDKIVQTAERVLVENNCFDKVTCEISQTAIDRRTYDDLTVPAGNYTALNVTIGEGGGKNWWCVMYPPLCVPCASVDMTDEEIMELYGGELTEEDIFLMSEGESYKPKIYIVELLEKLSK